MQHGKALRVPWGYKRGKLVLCKARNAGVQPGGELGLSRGNGRAVGKLSVLDLSKWIDLECRSCMPENRDLATKL